MKANSTQLVVVGGGPGGYAAAFLAADLGLQVTLVDLDANPGGVCLYRGCIPSKALLHVAKVLSEAEEVLECGVKFTKPKIDLDKMRAWKDQVVQKMTGGLGQLCKRRSVAYIQGRAIFEDSKELKIDLVQGGEERLRFEHAIIATGSRPATIPDLIPNSARVMNSSSALELEDIPKTLLVVGGGYIGLEMATVYSALGSKVTVVEMTPGLLPGADRDMVNILAKRVGRILHSVLVDTKLVEMTEEPTGIRAKMVDANGDTIQQKFEKVLVSVGRRPNSSGLGLGSTKAKVNERGFIEVDEQRRTADPNIFAIGDVAGEPMLAHKASHEGFVAAEVIAGKKVAFEPRAIPAVVFTDPELAWCGLTENEAKAEGRKVSVSRFPWGASGRATTLNRDDGMTKLIVDPETEQVLGVGIVGPGAGELIAEGVLAVEMGALASDLKLCIHPHPTLSETIMESAELFYGHCTHMYRPKRK